MSSNFEKQSLITTMYEMLGGKNLQFALNNANSTVIYYFYYFLDFSSCNLNLKTN